MARHNPRVLAELTRLARDGRSFDSNEIEAAVADLADPAAPDEAKAELLLALAGRGETPEEIAGFAAALIRRAEPFPLDSETRAGELLDLCGAGGDQMGTFNISTAAALVCAAAGVRVAKHGNRAVTSRCGSADVLDALGVSIHLSPAESAAQLRDHCFTFLFAPSYHPAFKAIGPARRLCAAKNRRTVFNAMGPLLNPARPTAQLVGVSQPALVEPMARALQGLGVRRAMAAAGEAPPRGWLDELSILGVNEVAEYYQDRGLNVSRWTAGFLPLQPARLEDLAGGGPAENAACIEALLAGADRSPRRDAVLLNAGAGLMLGGLTRTIAEGWDLAAAAIDSGRASATLAALRRR